MFEELISMQKSMTRKSFYIKIIFILISVIGLNILTRLIINDFFWGNKELYVKNYLFEKKTDFNCAFIGSSFTKRSIIPEIIDSICMNYQVKSFNLGAPHTFPPETFYYCNYLIKNNNVKTIFIELFPYKFCIQEEIMTENYYFFNLKTQFIYQLNNFFQPRNFKNWEINANNIIIPIKYSLYNLSNVDFLTQISLYKSENNFKTIVKSQQQGMSKSGFVPFKGEKDSTQKQNNEALGQNMMIFSKIAQQNDTELNRAQITYYKNITELNNRCKQKGIEILWVLPPGMKTDALNFILPIFKLIESSKKINMADPLKYREFYHNNLFYDKVHLNLAGAKNYSKFIANEYIALKKTHN
jgi:hypothetical protein